MALGKSYQQYRRQVAERIGAEEEEKLRMEAAQETKAEDVQRDKDGDVIRLFYEPASKRYFHATMSRVIEASYYFNRELATNGCISVNEWCNYLCADELTITPEGDQMGWCIDQLIYDWDAYGMDFEYDKQMTDDGLECYYLAPALDLFHRRRRRCFCRIHPRASCRVVWKYSLGVMPYSFLKARKKWL